MSEVQVAYGDNVAGTAGLLLNTARDLGLSTSVVKTTSDGVFLVPEEVADAAGLSYDVTEAQEAPQEVPQEPQGASEGDDQAVEVPAGTTEERVAWVAEGEDESERTKRANAVHLHETEVGDVSEEDLEQLSKDLTVAVYQDGRDDLDSGDTKDEDDTKDEPQDEPLVGKALNEALEAAGLSKSGKVAEKQARLAEHQKNKE